MKMDEWDAVEELCKILKVSFHFLSISYLHIKLTQLHVHIQVFHFSTKHMEGDFASGSVLLAEYLRVNEVLNQLRDTSNFPSLISMIDTMLAKLAAYQEEAVSSDVIVLATIMNPKYRLCFFDLHYCENSERAQELMQKVFQVALGAWPVTPPSTPPPNPSTSGSGEPFDHFAIFTSSATFQSSKSI